MASLLKVLSTAALVALACLAATGASGQASETTFLAVPAQFTGSQPLSDYLFGSGDDGSSDPNDDDANSENKSRSETTEDKRKRCGRSRRTRARRRSAVKLSKGGSRGRRVRRRCRARRLLPPASPVLGQRLNADRAEGTVTIRQPDTTNFLSLKDDARIPVGSTVDAREGAVKVTTASDDDGGTQSATFSHGVFQVRQRSTSPVTTLVLRGRLGTCGKRIASASRHRGRRRLWGRGRGRFRTRGRHSATSVRGTIWLTEDRCNGTLTRVRRGTVAVRDRVRKRTVLVSAGKQYFARGRR
jgi:hypothetical protein